MKGIKHFRKRLLVTEGDFYQLYKEIEQIRNNETKALYGAKFRALLKECQFVSLTLEPKKENQ